MAALPVATRSICPHCGTGLDAELIDRDGRVILRRECPEHGPIEALAYGDTARWRDAQRYERPGAAPLLRQTATDRGCPRDCGICPEHAQHTCLGIIEVNTGCNLDCPVCFAESGTGHQPDGYSLSLAQVEAMLDAFVAAEGAPEAVQLSGGEPSIHPEILDMLAAARAREIPLVMLNTNGIRLARDARFAPALAALGIHVYLQFDGFDDDTHLAIRGRRLQAIKHAALDRCAAAGVGVSLAAAVERGINEHELGAIVRFGVEHPAVNGVFLQPVTHTGRHPGFDPLDRLTNVEVIRGLCAQLPEWFREGDFVAVPCCSPTCRSATYALYDGEDLVPLPRLVDIDRYLGFVTNRAVPDLEVAAALAGLFSASAAGGTERTGDRLECVACAVGLPDELQQIAARGFLVVAQDFQDEWTLDVAKLRKCCVAEIVPDGRIIPFCAYNAAGYRAQVRADLAAQGNRVIAGVPLDDLETDPKGCCARLYESHAVRWLLNDQLHPGGEPLTLRLGRLAGVAPGTRIVDVACGSGTTALLLARELGCVTVGVDLGTRAIEHARRATPAGVRASFLLGDAEALPLTDASFDVALSECSLCTFPDKPRAIAEMARVIRPGGRIAIADVTADPDALPAQLRTAAAQLACVADARSASAYAALLRDAGCEPLAIEPHNAALRAMADRVEARLRLARMLAPPGDQRERIREAAALARLAIDTIARGHLGYTLITARA